MRIKAKIRVMSGTYKDLFSVQAENYAKYRPGYPPELFRYFASLTDNHTLAWDVGTGNGQAAIELTRYYNQVVATDPSQKQLDLAIQDKHITYFLAPAEKSPLHDNTADLITVAQAFHWFDQTKFFLEVARVAKPGAIVAIWCYEMAKINPEVDAKIMELYNDILGNYWEKERKLVEEGYRNEYIPFREIKAPEFTLHAEWTLNHLMGYLSTWSALQKYIQEEGSNPLQKFYPELKTIWGNDEKKKVTWDLGLRISQI